jgi:hypothetical protein
VEALKSPCIGCDLEHADKNNPECMGCDKRWQRIDDIEKGDNWAPGDSRGQGREGKAMTEEKSIEEMIAGICKEEGASIEYLKSGIRSRAAGRARKRIIVLLDEKKWKISAIAETVGITDASVYGALDRHKKKMKEPPPPDFQICKQKDCELAGIEQPIGNFQIHGPSRKPMTTCKKCMAKKKRQGWADRKQKQEQNQPDQQEDVIIPSENQLTIEFKEHADILDRLNKLAAKELRKVENQVLYMLIHELPVYEDAHEEIDIGPGMEAA